MMIARKMRTMPPVIQDWMQDQVWSLWMQARAMNAAQAAPQAAQPLNVQQEPQVDMGTGSQPNLQVLHYQNL